MFDARVANTDFAPPPTAVLPTPSARASFEASDAFYVAQGDMQRAFCHVAPPSGLGEHFRLPTISNSFVAPTALGCVALNAGAMLQPVALVMPMGMELGFVLLSVHPRPGHGRLGDRASASRCRRPPRWRR